MYSLHLEEKEIIAGISANRPDSITEERFYKQILTYSAVVVAVGPLLVWAAVVLPGWV
jgi:hypothetical protein